MHVFNHITGTLTAHGAISSKRTHHFLTSLFVAHPQMPMLLDSYATYKAGHQTALQSVADNKLHNLEFQRYVETAQGCRPRLPLDAFLAFPLHHLQELVHDFSDIAAKFPEHAQLAELVEGERPHNYSCSLLKNNLTIFI